MFLSIFRHLVFVPLQSRSGLRFSSRPVMSHSGFFPLRSGEKYRIFSKVSCPESFPPCGMERGGNRFKDNEGRNQSCCFLSPSDPAAKTTPLEKERTAQKNKPRYIRSRKDGKRAILIEGACMMGRIFLRHVALLYKHK